MTQDPSVPLCQLEIFTASSTSARALLGSGFMAGLTLPTWSSRLQSAHATGLDPTPTQGLLTLSSWLNPGVLWAVFTVLPDLWMRGTWWNLKTWRYQQSRSPKGCYSSRLGISKFEPTGSITVCSFLPSAHFGKGGHSSFATAPLWPVAPGWSGTTAADSHHVRWRVGWLQCYSSFLNRHLVGSGFLSHVQEEWGYMDTREWARQGRIFLSKKKALDNERGLK